jgi:formate-dependent nitrite reductase cytochrome c552 subunit
MYLSNLEEAIYHGWDSFHSAIPCKRGHLGLQLVKLVDSKEPSPINNYKSVCAECHKQTEGRALRAAAKELGLTKYTTGEPCSNGHTSERWVYNGGCVQCMTEATARGVKAKRDRAKLEAAVQLVAAHCHAAKLHELGDKVTALLG